jgi:hypothetical protein
MTTRGDARQKAPKSCDHVVTPAASLPSDQASQGVQATTNPVPNRSGNGPARGYSWPPFEAGNAIALRHGADSARAILARAEAVREALLTVAPHLGEHPTFAIVFAVERWMRVQARSLLLSDYIEHLVDEKGPQAVPQRVWEAANATDRLARDLGTDIGLDPRSFAELTTLVADATKAGANLAELAVTGAAIRARRQAALDGPDAEGTADATD